jgi:predicted ribosome quality control (RQC) complex YloA/Tae2 family protein
MAFDGIVTKSVISELNSFLLGTKVNKVLEPTKNEIVLELYGNRNNYSLLLSCDPDFCRINLTKNSKPNPQNAYNFCMLLRKYLVGGKISSISNYDLERTVQIKFDCYNEMNDLVTRKLYIEIMSRQSNIVLTNENNIIIDSLKHFDNNVRELLPAHEYTFVPINKVK